MSEVRGAHRLSCVTEHPRREVLLITLARVATRGGAAPYSVVRSEERQ